MARYHSKVQYNWNGTRYTAIQYVEHFSQYDFNGPIECMVALAKQIEAKYVPGKPIKVLSEYVDGEHYRTVTFDSFSLSWEKDEDGYNLLYVIGGRGLLPEEQDLLEAKRIADETKQKQRDEAEFERLKASLGK